MGSAIAIKKKKLFFFVRLPPKDVDTRQIKVIEGELEIHVFGKFAYQRVFDG